MPFIYVTVCVFKFSCVDLHDIKNKAHSRFVLG